jgi:hypothetical protein
MPLPSPLAQPTSWRTTPCQLSWLFIQYIRLSLHLNGQNYTYSL